MNRFTPFVALAVILAGGGSLQVNGAASHRGSLSSENPVKSAGKGNASTDYSGTRSSEGDSSVDWSVEDGGETETGEWVDVTLDVPGSLGVQILYQANMLSDVVRLRISGEMNDADWTTISNCANLKSLDLSGASAKYIPQNQFNGKGLTDILLPSDLEEIRNQAFYNTQLTKIVFPASLLRFTGESHFSRAPLENVTFEEGCAVTSLANSIFGNCVKLTTVVLPKNLETLNRGTFYNCNSLESIMLPETLRAIDDQVFYSNKGIKEIVIPENVESIGSDAFGYSGLVHATLPEKLKTLGANVFYYCESLEEVTLPATITEYNNDTFTGCKSMKKIISRSAVPPTPVSRYNFNQSEVDLVVPEFAVADYKLDDYWHNFKSITGGATSGYYKVGSGRTLTMSGNLRFDGKPTLEVDATGQLMVSGSSPLALEKLVLRHNANTYNNTNTFGQLINSSPSMSADAAEIAMAVVSNRWYFFSLPMDVALKDVYGSNSEASFIIRRYDGAKRAESGTGNSWQDLDAETILKAGQGYILQTNNDQTITFPRLSGEENLFDPNARLLALEENLSETPSNAGWNLVGNPWSSRYDMYYSMLTCPITLWNPYYSRYDAYSLIDDDVVLAPGEAFFIQSSENLKEIEFGTKGRQFDSSVSRPSSAPRRKGSASGREIFNLTLKAGDMSDRTRVVLNEDAEFGYENGRDASKFFSDNSAVPALYTLDADGNALAINERPCGDGVVDLSLHLPAATEASIEITRADGVLELTDTLLGKTLRMDEGESYLFEVAEGGVSEGRFKLRLASSGSSVGNIGSHSGSMRVVSDGREVIVSGISERLTVYTLDGRVVETATVSGGEARLNLEPGIYLMRSGSEVRKVSVK